MSLLKELEVAVLRLPAKDRVRLADRLLGTLPAPLGQSPAAILAEAERRDDEIENGKVRPLTEQEFWAGVRRRRA
ncbi:MAG: addiction module protein [Opitutaceae bacterium]|nr:addiction module protein [Opitutaceae bacterium]